MAQCRSNIPTQFNIRSVAEALVLRGFGAVTFSVVQRPRFTGQVNACRPSVTAIVDTLQYQVSGRMQAQCGSHCGHCTVPG